MRSRRQNEKGGKKRQQTIGVEPKMLICCHIKRESLFQNIDFHTAGMKNNIGHCLRCASTGRLWTVTKENCLLHGLEAKEAHEPRTAELLFSCK